MIQRVSTDALVVQHQHLNDKIVNCEKCPRLREYCSVVAKEKRRMFMDWDYWGKPVPNFGDIDARIVVVGLAPAAHGANRTGRMFTGDESGNWLIRALFEAGLSNQPHSINQDDGLQLQDIFITASVHCAPPANKPTREELDNCRGWLVDTFKMLRDWRVIVALGRVGFEQVLAVLRALEISNSIRRSHFGHNVVFNISGGRSIVCSFHPSQQNTFTGKLTHDMLVSVFETAKLLAGI